nr:Gag-Pol polyprotein [Tanacetum cinerariifolium]
IAKPITPPSETASEEDSDPEQAQRDKDMQNNLALIAKYFKKIYKPTNNYLRTSSNSKNKNMDMTLRYKNDIQSGQFGNQRTVNVAGAREITKKPNVVPISSRKPKAHANKSVATPYKKKFASKSTNQNPQSYFRMMYENSCKTWKWWIEQQIPSGYKWVPKAKMQWVPKAKNDKVQTIIVQIILFIVNSGCTKHMTGSLKLLCNFVEKFMGTVHFGNDQFKPILGYGDLVQGNVVINMVYYVEGLNHKLFLVGSNPQNKQPTINIQPTSAPSTPTYVHVEENNDDQAEEDHLPNDEFTNPLCAPAQEVVESSSHNIEQVRGNPLRSVQTRRQLTTDPEMCMFALTVSTAKPTNIKEAMADFAWIEAMQEELYQLDRLQVWELVDKTFGKIVIRLKWLWKNKKDED